MTMGNVRTTFVENAPADTRSVVFPDARGRRLLVFDGQSHD
jgi:hypothetical protein